MGGPSAFVSVALGALVITSAFGIGSAFAAPTAPNGTAGLLPSMLVTDAVPLPTNVVASPVAPSSPIPITVTLADRDPGGLTSFLAALDQPGSSAYRHFLTTDQFLSRYGPTSAAASTVARVLSSDGGRSTMIDAGQLAVTSVLPARSVDSLFGVSVVSFSTTTGSSVYTTVGNPRLPPGLSGLVVGIGGLSDAGTASLTYDLATSAPVTAPGTSNQFIPSNPPGTEWFFGSDFTQAYGATRLFPGNTTSITNASFPTHVAVATLLASGYNASHAVNLPPYDPSVLAWYLNHTLPSSWPQSNITGIPVTEGGVTPPSPGPSAELNDSSLDQVENSLDLEMAGSLAPGAPLYNFYFAGSLLGSGTWSDAADLFAADLSAALNYNYSPARLGVVSASFGLPDLTDALWNSDLEEAAATGVTVIVASGDQGNAPDNATGRPDGPWPTWPGSASFDTSGSLTVGGVSVTLSGIPEGGINATGHLNATFDPHVTGIASMSAWYETRGGPGNIEGTEGGASTVVREPSWQFVSSAQSSIVNATVLEGLHVLGRAEPDVAFPANDTLTMYGYNGTTARYFGSVVEGTSISAPVFAGLLADMIAVKSDDSLASWHPFGFLDPEIYRIGSYFDSHATSGNPFYSVTQGSNYLYTAGPGWNPLGGWGGLIAPLFLAADQNQTVRNYIWSGPTPGLPTSPGSNALPWSELVLGLGVGFLAVGLVGIAVVRARARSRPPTSAPSFPAGPSSIPGASTFLCPYCGWPRPTEPVRCPQCGAY